MCVAFLVTETTLVDAAGTIDAGIVGFCERFVFVTFLSFLFFSVCVDISVLGLFLSLIENNTLTNFWLLPFHSLSLSFFVSFDVLEI